MIVLVLGELVIALLAHEALLQREMRRDRLVEVAEEAEYGHLGPLRLRLFVQAVDQFDELAMLVVDRLDADAVALLPVQQAHDVLLSER